MLSNVCSRPSDTNGDTASAAISVGQFEIGDAIDGACNELIINKEQVVYFKTFFL